MTNGNGTRRVVVTGLGAVTPIGLNVADFWASIREGKSGVSELGGFPLEDLKILIAAQIKDFDPKVQLKNYKRDKIIMHADRYSWFAAAAAEEAVAQSGLETPFTDPYRAACIIGSGAGGLMTYENSYRALFIENKRATHPLTLLRIIGSSASAHVGIEFGIKGPTFATCSACSTATHAIGLTYRMIREGLVDLRVGGDVGVARRDLVGARAEGTPGMSGRPDLVGIFSSGRDGSTLLQFPGEAGKQEQFDWVALGVPANEQYGVRGISSGRMPHFSKQLSEEQITLIVEYERHEPGTAPDGRKMNKPYHVAHYDFRLVPA